jgi:hypothetical protein
MWQSYHQGGDLQFDVSSSIEDVGILHFKQSMVFCINLMPVTGYLLRDWDVK